jgi:hypothetical protein
MFYAIIDELAAKLIAVKKAGPSVRVMKHGVGLE